MLYRPQVYCLVYAGLSGRNHVTLRNFFRSTASQGFQNTKWPAVLYSQYISQNRKIPANLSITCRDPDQTSRFWFCGISIIGVRGGAMGATAPPNFWQLRFFGAGRENLGKTSFLRRFLVFWIIILKRWIFYILTWSWRNNPVLLQSHETVVA